MEYLVLFFDRSGQVFNIEKCTENQLQLIILDFEVDGTCLDEPVRNLEVYKLLDVYGEE